MGQNSNQYNQHTQIQIQYVPIKKIPQRLNMKVQYKNNNKSSLYKKNIFMVHVFLITCWQSCFPVVEKIANKYLTIIVDSQPTVHAQTLLLVPDDLMTVVQYPQKSSYVIDNIQLTSVIKVVGGDGRGSNIDRSKPSLFTRVITRSIVELQ